MSMGGSDMGNDLERFFNNKAMQIRPGTVLEVQASDVANASLAEGDGIFSEADVGKIRTALEFAGLATEPDIEKCYRKISFSEAFYLYKNNEKSTQTAKWLLQEKVLFSLMALVAKSNGKVDRNEVNFITRRCQLRSIEARFSKAQLTAIALRALGRSSQDLKNVLGLLKKYFPNPDSILEAAKDIILSDHKIDRGEISCFIQLHSIYYEYPLTYAQAKKTLIDRATEMYITIGPAQKESDLEESIQENLDDFIGQSEPEEDVLGTILDSF